MSPSSEANGQMQNVAGPPEDEKERQGRPPSASERPPANRLVPILNSAFFLGILSAVALVIGGTFFTTQQKCIEEGTRLSQRFSRLAMEMNNRRAFAFSALQASGTAAEYKAFLDMSPRLFSEFKDNTAGDLWIQLAEILARTRDKDAVTSRFRLTQVDEILVGPSVLGGKLPSIDDDYLKRLRENGENQRFVAYPMVLSPACGIKDVFSQMAFASRVPVELDSNQDYSAVELLLKLQSGTMANTKKGPPAKPEVTVENNPPPQNVPNAPSNSPPDFQRAAIPSPFGPDAIFLVPADRYIYRISSNGKAERFGIITPEKTCPEYFLKIGKISAWPSWRPPQRLSARLAGPPKTVPGGNPDNPLGARSIDLLNEKGKLVGRISGTNTPEKVGSSADAQFCSYSMKNEDVIDFARRIRTGMRVRVVRSQAGS